MEELENHKEFVKELKNMIRNTGKSNTIFVYELEALMVERGL